MLPLRLFRSLFRLSSTLQQIPVPYASSTPSSFLHTSCSYRIPEAQAKDTDAKGESRSRSRENESDSSTNQQRGKKEKVDAAAESDEKTLVKYGHMFEHIPPDQKTKETFQKAIGLFLERNVHRRGQVEFIYAALRHMKEFGVLRDLETYKQLLEIFPKGKMIAENYFQAFSKYYPKHQDCCITLLDQMEYYGCHPDKEVYQMVKNIFGDDSFAMSKMQRMMYWMPKFRYANPYRSPDPVPSAPIELAKQAIKKMCRDPANEVHVWFTEAMPDPPEKTWVVCGQSCHQRDLLNEHPEDKPLCVDGPFREWLQYEFVSYFVLLADAKAEKFYSDIDPDEPETAEEWANWETKFNTEFPQSRKALIEAPTVHEQEDGTILSVAVTGSSTKESLVCWINFLQHLNPKLAKIPVVFRMSHGFGEVVVRKAAVNEKKEVVKSSV